jgi:hypothetical protein
MLKLYSELLSGSSRGAEKGRGPILPGSLSGLLRESINILREREVEVPVKRARAPYPLSKSAQFSSLLGIESADAFGRVVFYVDRVFA